MSYLCEINLSAWLPNFLYRIGQPNSTPTVLSTQLDDLEEASTPLLSLQTSNPAVSRGYTLNGIFCIAGSVLASLLSVGLTPTLWSAWPLWLPCAIGIGVGLLLIGLAFRQTQANATANEQPVIKGDKTNFGACNNQEISSAISFEIGYSYPRIHLHPQFILPKICQSIQGWQTMEASAIQRLIEDSLKSKSFGSGSDAKIYPIPGYQELVLRVEGKTNGIDFSELRPVFIKWEASVADNPHAGIPVAVLLDAKSELGKYSQLNRRDLQQHLKEHPSEKIQLYVLRKVSGSLVTKDYLESANTLGRLEKACYYDNVDIQANEVKQLRYYFHYDEEADGTPSDDLAQKLSKINWGYRRPLDDLDRFYEANQSDPSTGRKAACYLLNQLCSGQPFKILKEHSDQLGFQVPHDIKQSKYGEKKTQRFSQLTNIGKDFYKPYDQLVKSFLKTTKEIAEMPQPAFKHAVDFLSNAHRNGILLDLTHPANVLIDTTEGQEAFNFVDLCPTAENDASIKQCNRSLEILISTFEQGLLASNAFRLGSFCDPHQLIYREEEFQEYEKYKEIIIRKVQTATDKLSEGMMDR